MYLLIIISVYYQVLSVYYQVLNVYNQVLSASLSFFKQNLVDTTLTRLCLPCAPSMWSNKSRYPNRSLRFY